MGLLRLEGQMLGNGPLMLPMLNVLGLLADQIVFDFRLPLEGTRLMYNNRLKLGI